MFDSGISVKNLVSELIDEVDIALQIPKATYVSWLNSLQHTLYTEIIKEQKIHHETFVVLFPVTDKKMINNNFMLSRIVVEENESAPRFEDIHAVYVDGLQLIKSTPSSGLIFPNTFYKNGNNLGYRTFDVIQSLEIVYLVKPALVTVTDKDEIISEYVAEDGTTKEVNVMVPVEFIDLVKAKLRGEAYKLANEGELSAMWLNDYNILLETFKAWIAEKSPNFGM